MVSPLEDLLPGLRGTAWRVTSPAERRYNCIARAAGVTNAWWWPGPDPEIYWPPGVPRTEALAVFEAAFAQIGYAPCEAEELEAGWEKVAIYATASGLPAHMARQLDDGRWTSKLGEEVDIAHDLPALADYEYGAVVRVLRPSRRPNGWESDEVGRVHRESSVHDFGLLIAYVLPGFTALRGTTYAWPLFRPWFGLSTGQEPTLRLG